MEPLISSAQYWEIRWWSEVKCLKPHQIAWTLGLPVSWVHRVLA